MEMECLGFDEEEGFGMMPFGGGMGGLLPAAAGVLPAFAGAATGAGIRPVHPFGWHEEAHEEGFGMHPAGWHEEAHEEGFGLHPAGWHPVGWHEEAEEGFHPAHAAAAAAASGLLPAAGFHPAGWHEDAHEEGFGMHPAGWHPAGWHGEHAEEAHENNAFNFRQGFHPATGVMPGYHPGIGAGLPGAGLMPFGYGEGEWGEGFGGLQKSNPESKEAKPEAKEETTPEEAKKEHDVVFPEPKLEAVKKVEQVNPFAAGIMSGLIGGGDGFGDFEMGEFEGAELPLPGHIMISFDEDHSSATKIRMNYQMLAGYLGVKLHWVITDQIHVTLPDIALGNFAACETCSGTLPLVDHSAHWADIPVKLGKGHYGLWAVGEGRSDVFTKQLILALPYGLYWNIGPAAVEFSFLFANMGCNEYEDARHHGMAFAANAEDCAYIAASNTWCGNQFMFNTMNHVCSCMTFGAMQCDMESHPGSNIYKITHINGQKRNFVPRATPFANKVRKIAPHGKEKEDHQIFGALWMYFAGGFSSFLLLLFLYVFFPSRWKRRSPYPVDLDTTYYTMRGENLLPTPSEV